MALDKSKRGFSIDLESRLKRPGHEEPDAGKETAAGKEQETENPVQETQVVPESNKTEETAVVPVDTTLPAEIEATEQSINLADFVGKKMKKKRKVRNVRLSTVITQDLSDQLDELDGKGLITSKNDLVNILLEKYVQEAMKAGLLKDKGQ